MEEHAVMESRLPNEGSTTEVTGEVSSRAPGGSVGSDVNSLSGYEDLFDGQGDTEAALPAGIPPDELRKYFESLLAVAKGSGDRLGAIEERMSEMSREVTRLHTDERVFTEVQARYQELSEEFYEREVLTPVILTLIGIADRCTQGAAKAAELATSEAAAKNQAAARALRHIHQAREADRIEILNQLANLGVESFLSPDDLFDPACQRCVSRVLSNSANVHGQIAKRISQGYRRNARVIRHECVAVYVAADENNGKATGDQS